MVSSPSNAQPGEKIHIPLRERKSARTKHALLQAALERLRHKRFDEIPVKELCEAAEVSEATFFNYFPRKEDLLRYFIRLWIVELYWRAQERVGNDDSLDFIGAVFDFASEQLKDHPRLIMEVIAYMAQQAHPGKCPSEKPEPILSLAERMQALPECCCKEPLPEPRLGELFRPALEHSVAAGELSKDVRVESALMSLLSTFVGVPFWLGADCPDCIGPAYRTQLELLWRGLGRS